MSKDKTDKKDPQMVSFLQMFKYSDLKVRVFLFIGILSSVLAGLSLPAFTIFIGDLYNSYHPDKEKEDAYGMFTKGKIYFLV